MPKGDKFKLKADPEDGTTPVSNLLLEALALSNLSGTEKSIVLLLWRKTYGWVVNGERQKETCLHRPEIAEYLRVSERAIFKCIKHLAEAKIILRKDLGQGKGYIYQMNTRISNWNSGTINQRLLKKFSGLEQNDGGEQIVLPLNESSPPEVTDMNKSSGVDVNKSSGVDVNKSSHPTLYKEILNKPLKETSTSEPCPDRAVLLANYLKERVLINNPGAKVPDNLAKWSKEIGLMLRLDKRTPQEIHDVIDFCQSDSFWMSNILSASSLREKFDRLYMKMKSKNGGTTNTHLEPLEGVIIE